MRILAIGPCPPPLGGTSVSFRYLIAELERRGECSVTVVRTGTSGSRLEKIWKAGIDLVRLVWLIRKHDVVGFHASTERALTFGFLLRIACKLHRKPLVFRIFGGNLMGVYSEGGILVRKMVASLFSAEEVLLQSQKLTTSFQQIFPNARVRWFPTSRPIVDGIISKDMIGLPRRFVFLSHLKLEKGVGVIIDAVLRLRSSQFSVEFFGGQASDELVARIRETPGCSYGGVLEPEEVIEKLKEADVLLLPTYYKGEGYPGIIIEAFHCAVPVIATNWKFIPEIVTDQINGLLVPVSDVECLAVAMERMIDDPHLFRILSQGALSSGHFFSSEQWNGVEYLRVCREAIDLA